MSNLDGRAAWILLTVLMLTAAIGFEQGLVRALAAAREAAPAASAGPDREPVPRAQPLSSAMDETAVRQIARQEAEAAISRSRPRKPQPAEDADAADDAADAPSAPPAAPVIPVPAAPAAPSPG